MKKSKKIILVILALCLGFASCSKSNSKPKTSQKDEFFTQLESLVNKAENNSQAEKIDQFKEEYDNFLKKYPKITSSSGWTAEDTEKMEDLQKRFSLLTVPMTDDFSNNFDDSQNYDLGLDSDLNFGDSDVFGGLSLDGLEGLDLDLSLGNSDYSMPDLNLDAILNDILSDSN